MKKQLFFPTGGTGKYTSSPYFLITTSFPENHQQGFSCYCTNKIKASSHLSLCSAAPSFQYTLSSLPWMNWFSEASPSNTLLNPNLLTASPPPSQTRNAILKKTATFLLKLRSRTEFTAIRPPPAVSQKGKTDSEPGYERSIAPAKTAYPNQNIYRTIKRAWSGSGFLHRASPPCRKMLPYAGVRFSRQ